MEWDLAAVAPATVRDSGEAIFIAEHVARLTGNQDAKNLDVLAMAYAEAGNFDRAVITAKMAFKFALLANDMEYTKEIRGRMELYRQNKPFRIPDLR